MTDKDFEKLRAKLGLSVVDFAHELAITPVMAWAYAKGERPIPRKIALAAAAVNAGLAPYGAAK